MTDGELRRRLDLIQRLLVLVLGQDTLEIVMAAAANEALAELDAKIDAHDAEDGLVSTELAELAAEIKGLQVGVPVTAEQIEGLTSKLGAGLDGLKAAAEAAEPAPAAETPTPPAEAGGETEPEAPVPGTPAA